MKDAHAALMRALATCRPGLSQGDAEEIERLAEIIAPYEGDDPEAATSRKVLSAECARCGFSWPVLAFPADASRTARSALRHGQCPRCFATEGSVLKAD